MHRRVFCRAGDILIDTCIAGVVVTLPNVLQENSEVKVLPVVPDSGIAKTTLILYAMQHRCNPSPEAYLSTPRLAEFGGGARSFAGDAEGWHGRTAAGGRLALGIAGVPGVISS